MKNTEHARLLRELATDNEMLLEAVRRQGLLSLISGRQLIGDAAARARQAAEEIEGQGQQYPPLHRWNFEMREDGLYACRHLHDKGQHCEYERLTETMVRKGARFGGGEGK